MAYKITVVSSPWALKTDIYFAPDIANILKVSINMEDILIIEGELKSSTFVS
jgi:hypothetical protein